MKIFLHIILALTFSCCHFKQQEIKEAINLWQNKEIIFPTSLHSQIQQNDYNYGNRYKILNYIDTSGCTDCRLKLYEWNLLKKQADSLNLDVSFVFIAHLNNYNKLKKIEKINKCSIPIIYDTLDILNQTNRFHKDERFHTFLLDKANKVVLLGNPVNNSKLWSLYKQTIKNAQLSR